MNKYKVLFVLFLCLLTVACGKKVSKEDDVYKIAVVSPLSGPDAPLGISIANGAELAVIEANAQGGINRKRITLIKEDDGGLVGEGAFFAYRLTRADMILGVIGHLDSDISIPASEFYTRAKIPQISPGTTSPYFTERKATMGYVFRTIGRDDIEGKILADYIINNGFKRIAVLYNEREYGRSLASEFAKNLKTYSSQKTKPTIVYYNMIQEDKSDYGALLTHLSLYKPDTIFLAGEYNDAGTLVKDFSKYGLEKVLFLGGDGIYHSDFIRIGGINTEGAVVISPPPIVDTGFISRYKEHFKEDSTGYAANSYDATNILINAIKEVKEKDSGKIANFVAATMNFKGVTGEISFDEKGDLTSLGFVLNKVVDGKFQVIKNGNK